MSVAEKKFMPGLFTSISNMMISAAHVLGRSEGSGGPMGSGAP